MTVDDYAYATIARATVGLLPVSDSLTKAQARTIEPFGSGTLVKCRTTQGILTCGHVVKVIEKHQSVGIVQFPVRAEQYQAIKFAGPAAASASIVHYDPHNEIDGPDLAFVPLAPSIMATLAATGSVIDLDLQKSRAETPVSGGHMSYEAVAGVIAEFTGEPNIRDSTAVVKVEGLMNVGKFTPLGRRGEYDLLSHLPDMEGRRPTSYGGTSGGGMWQLVFPPDAGQDAELLETRLVGVAFYETGDSYRRLIGHGPRSIYRVLLSDIYNRWPS